MTFVSSECFLAINLSPLYKKKLPPLHKPHLLTGKLHLPDEKPHLLTKKLHLPVKKSHLLTKKLHLRVKKSHLLTRKPHLLTKKLYLPDNKSYPPSDSQKYDRTESYPLLNESSPFLILIESLFRLSNCTFVCFLALMN
jgi:hypothetical protein